MLNNIVKTFIDKHDRLNEQKVKMIKLILVLICVSTYFLLLYSLQLTKENTKERIVNEKEAILWIQQWSRFIKKNGHEPAYHNRQLSVSDIESSLETSGLKQYISSFKQNDQNTIDLSFRNVNFNQVYIWLLTLSKRGHINVDNLTVLNHGQGLVDIDLMLKLTV